MLQSVARRGGVASTVTMPTRAERAGVGVDLDLEEVARGADAAAARLLPAEPEPVVAGRHRDVLADHVGRASGRCRATPLSLSASRIAAGELSVTSPSACIAGAPAGTVEPARRRREVARRADVQLPVDWIWPTRRSPLVSVSMIEPFVFRSIRPLLSAVPRRARPRSASTKVRRRR